MAGPKCICMWSIHNKLIIYGISGSARGWSGFLKKLIFSQNTAGLNLPATSEYLV